MEKSNSIGGYFPVSKNRRETTWHSFHLFRHFAGYNKTSTEPSGIGKFFLQKILEFLNLPIRVETIALFLGSLKNTYGKLPNNLFLVLDDLERTRLPMELVLGYASTVLERGNTKVVLLCNEDELPSTRKSKNIFKKFKEKVVGTTLSVLPDADCVFEVCLAEIADEKASNILKENKPLILKIFSESNTQNMRSLRRLMENLRKIGNRCYELDLIKSTEFVTYMFSMCSILTIELDRLKDELNKNDIYSMYDTFFKPEGSITSIQNKYSFSPQLIKPSSFWKFFFEKSIIEDKLLKIIYTYITNTNLTELPVQLWNFYSMNDNDVIKLYDAMCIELNEKKYQNLPLVIMAFTNMMALSKFDVIDESIESIIYSAKKYINSMNINYDFNINEHIFHHSYEGRRFQCAKDEECLELLSFAQEIYRTKKYEFMVNKIHAAVTETTDSPSDLVTVLADIQKKEPEFPFEKIDEDKLGERIARTSNDFLESLFIRLGYFWEFRTLSSVQQTWLCSLSTTLHQQALCMPPLAKGRVQRFITSIKNILSSLEQ